LYDMMRFNWFDFALTFTCDRVHLGTVLLDLKGLFTQVSKPMKKKAAKRTVDHYFCAKCDGYHPLFVPIWSSMLAASHPTPNATVSPAMLVNESARVFPPGQYGS